MLVDVLGMKFTGLIFQAHVVAELALGAAHVGRDVYLLKNWAEIIITEGLG